MTPGNRARNHRRGRRQAAVQNHPPVKALRRGRLHLAAIRRQATAAAGTLTIRRIKMV